MTYSFGNVFIVERNTSIFCRKLDIGLFCKLLKPVHIGQIDAQANRPQRDGSVNGPSIDVHKSQFLSNAPRDRAFACACRPVDCDYNPLFTHMGCSQSSASLNHESLYLSLRTYELLSEYI